MGFLVYPVFLSVVIVTGNSSETIANRLANLTKVLAESTRDYEIIVIDNASHDNTNTVLRSLVASDGLPNLQVFRLLRETDIDIAIASGIEVSLGDYVLVSPGDGEDDFIIPKLMDAALGGSDVVFGANAAIKPSLLYRFSSFLFMKLYKASTGIDLRDAVGQIRLFSRRVVNYMLASNSPELSYRHLHALGGFPRTRVEYTTPPTRSSRTRYSVSLTRGIGILLSASLLPLRVATFTAVFGALLSLAYSIYVIFISLSEKNIAPGWASTSLQIALMFFCVSLVLLIHSEYSLRSKTAEIAGKRLYFGQEYSSAIIESKSRINVENDSRPDLPDSGK